MLQMLKELKAPIRIENERPMMQLKRNYIPILTSRFSIPSNEFFASVGGNPTNREISIVNPNSTAMNNLYLKFRKTLGKENKEIKDEKKLSNTELSTQFQRLEMMMSFIRKYFVETSDAAMVKIAGKWDGKNNKISSINTGLIPFSKFIRKKTGNCRVVAIVAALFICRMQKDKLLPEGDVRRVRGILNDGKEEVGHACVTFRPYNLNPPDVWCVDIFQKEKPLLLLADKNQFIKYGDLYKKCVFVNDISWVPPGFKFSYDSQTLKYTIKTTSTTEQEYCEIKENKNTAGKSGSSGTVVKVQSGTQAFAIKKINFNNINESDDRKIEIYQSLFREIQFNYTMYGVGASYCVQQLQAYPIVYCLMKYVEEKDWYEYHVQSESHFFKLTSSLLINALRMHDHFVHLDIHEGNVRVCDDKKNGPIVKFVDFGLSNYSNKKFLIYKNLNLSKKPPEYADKSEIVIHPSQDAWCIGRMLNQKYSELKTNKEIPSFIREMLIVDPQKRISIPQALATGYGQYFKDKIELDDAIRIFNAVKDEKSLGNFLSYLFSDVKDVFEKIVPQDYLEKIPPQALYLFITNLLKNSQADKSSIHRWCWCMDALGVLEQNKNDHTLLIKTTREYVSTEKKQVDDKYEHTLNAAMTKDIQTFLYYFAIIINSPSRQFLQEFFSKIIKSHFATHVTDLWNLGKPRNIIPINIQDELYVTLFELEKENLKNRLKDQKESFNFGYLYDLRCYLRDPNKLIYVLSKLSLEDQEILIRNLRYDDWARSNKVLMWPTALDINIQANILITMLTEIQRQLKLGKLGIYLNSEQRILINERWFYAEYLIFKLTSKLNAKTVELAILGLSRLLDGKFEYTNLTLFGEALLEQKEECGSQFFKFISHYVEFEYKYYELSLTSCKFLEMLNNRNIFYWIERSDFSSFFTLSEYHQRSLLKQLFEIKRSEYESIFNFLENRLDQWCSCRYAIIHSYNLPITELVNIFRSLNSMQNGLENLLHKCFDRFTSILRDLSEDNRELFVKIASLNKNIPPSTKSQLMVELFELKKVSYRSAFFEFDNMDKWCYCQAMQASAQTNYEHETKELKSNDREKLRCLTYDDLTPLKSEWKKEFGRNILRKLIVSPVNLISILCMIQEEEERICLLKYLNADAYFHNFYSYSFTYDLAGLFYDNLYEFFSFYIQSLERFHQNKLIHKEYKSENELKELTDKLYYCKSIKFKIKEFVLSWNVKLSHLPINQKKLDRYLAEKKYNSYWSSLDKLDYYESHKYSKELHNITRELESSCHQLFSKWKLNSGINQFVKIIEPYELEETLRLPYITDKITLLNKIGRKKLNTIFKNQKDRFLFFSKIEPGYTICKNQNKFSNFVVCNSLLPINQQKLFLELMGNDFLQGIAKKLPFSEYLDFIQHRYFNQFAPNLAKAINVKNKDRFLKIMFKGSVNNVIDNLISPDLSTTLSREQKTNKIHLSHSIGYYLLENFDLALTFERDRKKLLARIAHFLLPDKTIKSETEKECFHRNLAFSVINSLVRNEKSLEPFFQLLINQELSNFDIPLSMINIILEYGFESASENIPETVTHFSIHAFFKPVFAPSLIGTIINYVAEADFKKI